MARYGFCSQCNQSVWLNELDACPNGHGPECISGVVETIEPPQAPTQPLPQPLPQLLPQGTARSDSGKGSKTWLIVIAVAVLMVPGLLFLCGILTAIGIPVFNSASTGAESRACFAYERVMEGAYQQWLAESPDNQPEQVPDYRTLEATLLAGDYLPEPPVCPSGGTYEFSNGEVSCSTHGHY